MTTRILGVLVIAWLLTPGTGRSDEFDVPDRGPTRPLAERVNAAIDQGVAFLRTRQLDDGSWGPCLSSGVSYDGRATSRECYPAGPTAFALFTLARCGVARDDPQVQKGLAWLRDHDHRRSTFTTYEAAAALLALTALYEDDAPHAPSSTHHRRPPGSTFELRDWRRLHELVMALRARQRSSGGWGYYAGMHDADVSATQFALLSLRAAARAGYPVHRTVPVAWTRALEYLWDRQGNDGSFAYDAEERWSSGMTAAGLASLLICREQLQLLDRDVPDHVDDAVEAAFAFLDRKFRSATNHSGRELGGSRYHFCHLYAIERCGALGRRHRIGNRDWYAYGAEYLLYTQRAGGAWRDRTCMAPEDTLGTCFALLFLRRATPPAVVTPSAD